MVKISRALTAAALVLVAFRTARAAPGPADTFATEWEVKAAFLYNFARFVEWPERTAPDAPFVVAVLGGDPFGSVLDETLLGKSVGGRRIVLKRIGTVEEAEDAQIVFVGVSADRELAAILRVLRGRPVLTVADADGFAARGVMVNFRLVDNRVRFEINLARAVEAGLRISSQLLKLATSTSG